MNKTVLVIAGPTAVGKTALCVEVARHLQTEIISADSRQLYKELSIGTAKPTPGEMRGVPHHFIDSHSVTELVSAGQFEREALTLLDELFQHHSIVVVTGGTGLYIQALCTGLDDIPLPAGNIRDTLMQRLESEGLPALQTQLTQLDPDYVKEADLQNWQRVVRALEVCLTTGQPYSSFRQRSVKARPFKTIYCALERPREELYRRIDLRMDQMLNMGLVEEVSSLAEYRQHNALQTVGYKEVFEYLDGAYDYQTMVELLKRNSRRYAKRQLTWFRHQGSYTWFAADDLNGILAWVAEQCG
ncbi:tRNA (adenosine(37)-N6)-dimethylallyltransferase MiaA [Arsenicibacter rosenii]|uniref:tRNA dimethylallyltransferase n=1 Tax=Arsenicibacter rosenii TaxID=1750698 RepID=A0A1S2VCR7_9BACT|nr:tRNA (adenosine(37)-N6)-dimethylallyltransferase MiaA [Arsenicibacter rosenii]OIN56557.1 tRNA (adenosine(37)-N6)-dimethylallyltransferase MiaA [Arsenicibacter rosenii]